ncbi:MAG TPA: cupredoxin domain-containing protein [Actinomycetota bacterium]
MSRRLLSVALVLGLFAAACSKPPQTEVAFGSGKAFVPQVADFQDNVGLYPSVATDQQGTPYVVYFGFPQQLAEGEIAVPRPIGAPSVPSVDLVSVKEGIWTRGAVAMEASIPNVSVAFGPAEVPQVKNLTPANANGTSIAVDDSGGLHVAWTDGHGVWYANDMGGSSFMASQVEKLKPPLMQAGPVGAPSVAVVSGTPWVAYMMTSAKGRELRVARQEGGSWKTDVLETLPLQAGGPQPSRTVVGAGPNGPVVVYADGTNVRAAALGAGEEGGWGFSTVESGAGGVGLSIASATDGLHVAYYADGEVHTAVSKDGVTWQAATVSSVGTGQNEAGRSTGIAVDQSGAVYVTWYDPGTDSVQLASATGSEFAPLPTGDTNGGELPSLAVAPDGSNVYVAWYDRQTQDLELGTYGDVGGLELAMQSPTPTTTSSPTAAPPGGGQCTQAQNGKLTVTAEGIAFDTSCIEIPAGQPVTITFDNKDAGVQHNIAVFPSSTELTNPMFRGDLLTGPATTDYKVGPFDAGTYYFHCDVHPTMNGTLTVVSGTGGGSGGGSQGGGGGGGATEYTSMVTAQGIAFDSSTITLPANKASTLTFDNKDAGVQHNIAIFPSESDLTNPLFRGDLITGPDSIDYNIPALKPGTYYFHCDVHPTMNGQVVVK